MRGSTRGKAESISALAAVISAEKQKKKKLRQPFVFFDARGALSDTLTTSRNSNYPLLGS
jgi:hypothetical protein